MFTTEAPNAPDSGGRAAKTQTVSVPEAEREQLLLTDFENTTGEAIFDHTLKMALSFSLAQSPFLDILPDTKVAQTLRMMGRAPNDRVTRELGEEICVRQNLKAFITGTISSFGSTYVLTLEAVARTGQSLGREFEQVNSKEEVLNSLGRAAAGLREKLGESLSSIEKYDFPNSYATTSSLEALKLYTLARQQNAVGKFHEAVPLYKKALEHDPKFATAYAALAVYYANTRQWKLAAETITKAYDLRDTVSEIEKLRYTFFYHSFATGEVDKAIDALVLWRKTYPTHGAAAMNLSDLLERIGQSEKAASIAREAIQLEPANSVGYMNLSESLLSLNRYSEVKENCRSAFEKSLDNDSFHKFLYWVGIIENDTSAAQDNVKWFSGRADEYISLDMQTGTAAFQGKQQASLDLSRRAADLAARSNAKEVAGRYAAEQALRMAFWSGKNGLPAADETRSNQIIKTLTEKALQLEHGNEVITRAALALAMVGELDEANVIVDELKADRPNDTLINELWLPTVKAAIKLRSGEPQEAIQELELTERFEAVGEFYPQYLRGLAYLELDKPRQAMREFEKILNHRGEAPLSSIYPLAQLGKARALKDKAEYEKFFELWKDADHDLPALIAAKAEAS